MSTTFRVTLGACVLALGFGCRKPRPVEPARPSSAPDVVAVPAPPVARGPVDAGTAEDVPANVAEQRAMLRSCPAPAGTPTIAPEPDGGEEPARLWTPSTRRVAPGDAPAPLKAACAAIEGRRQAALARLGANAPDTTDDPHVEAVGRCLYAGGGAWALDPGAARVRSERDVTDEVTRKVEFAWTLAFVKADGTVLRARLPGGRAWWTVVHDFDGDGTAEAGLRVERQSGSAVPTTLYTMHDGAVVAYARAAGIAVDEARDVDSDGRPDFLTDSPFVTPNTCGPSTFYGVPEVVHALADGSFSRDDAVAREWMRQRCAGVTAAAADHLLDSGPPGREIVGRLGCLRYVGVSTEALLRALDAQWPAGSDDHCWSREAVVDSLRGARVPFQVAPCALAPSGR